MFPIEPNSSAVEQRLTALRNGLLTLHKSLLDSERESYEHDVARITSPNEMLHLVLNDPWFAWLRELSQLVVVIDEALDAKEKPTAIDADRYLAQSRELLVPNEEGTGFKKRYYEAMQRDPDVVLAHGRMRQTMVGLDSSAQKSD
jgi:hypothetical protein